MAVFYNPSKMFDCSPAAANTNNCFDMYYPTAANGYMMSMDDQEQKKLDRKRARNRAAASKCRQKKMDRIQELELQVSQEKQQAHELEMELARLRSTLSQLQQLLRQPQTVSQM